MRLLVIRPKVKNNQFSMNNTHVLVVDDHDSIRFLLGNFLSKKFKVSTKGDGLEALAWMSQGNMPDLIILDMSMPKLGGFDFLSNIKSSGFFKHIPVIILTGYADKRYEDQCKKLGAEDYILKPFNPIELMGKIERIVLPQNKRLEHKN